MDPPVLRDAAPSVETVLKPSERALLTSVRALRERASTLQSRVFSAAD